MPAAQQSPPTSEAVTAGVCASRIAERQTPSGGLNGRPEKLQDVCYSWWCLSALAILGRQHWIDEASLTRFILFCQVRGHSSDGILSGHIARGNGCNWVPAIPRMSRTSFKTRRRCSRWLSYPTPRILQDEDDGGISDRPEDAVDVFHTFFGIAGLSLLGYKGLQAVDPAFALPVDVVRRIQKRQSHGGGLKGDVLLR